MALDLGLYQPHVIDAICKTVCPTIDPKFVNKDLILSELSLHIEMYIRALLQPKYDEKLCTELEKLMLERVFLTTNNKMTEENNKMHEARYRVRKRKELDDKGEKGKPVPPSGFWFTVYELEIDYEKGDYKDYDQHPVSLWTGTEYPMNGTCTDLYNKVRANDCIHDADRPFKIYLGSKNDYKYSTKELLDLKCYSYLVDWTRPLDDDVNMNAHVIYGLIIYEAEKKHKKQKTELGNDVSSAN